MTLDYLLELRKRLLWCFITVVLIFCVLCFFTNTIYYHLALPLLNQLPGEKTLIAIAIASPFLVPFKLVFVLSVIISMPFLLYQLWAFVVPALYHHEKQLMWILLLSSVLLFYAGICFAYFIVFPLVFKFFIHAAPMSVEVRPDISQYLDFTLKLFFAFGFAFEVPVIVVLLAQSGVVTAQQLKHQRPYVIVGAFIVGMLLTPPDVISQTLLAVPLWLLFEIGVLLAACMEKIMSEKVAQ